MNTKFYIDGKWILHKAARHTAWDKPLPILVEGNAFDIMEVSDITGAHIIKSNKEEGEFVFLFDGAHAIRELIPSGKANFTMTTDTKDEGVPIQEHLRHVGFTVQAMAQKFDPVSGKRGQVIDPHAGRTDLLRRHLRFVVNPWFRIYEDPRRIIEALDFIVNLSLVPDTNAQKAIESEEAALAIQGIKRRDVRKLLEPVFSFNPIGACKLIASLPPHTQLALFGEDVFLQPLVG